MYIMVDGKIFIAAVINVGLYGYFLYRLMKVTAKIYHVEFDDDFLYVLRRGNDILIPLENVKSVEIKTFGGVYKIKLYYEDILGSYFYFKPSLIYPLNYRTKDELVDLLRTKIALAKKRKQPFPANALTS